LREKHEKKNFLLWTAAWKAGAKCIETHRISFESEGDILNRWQGTSSEEGTGKDATDCAGRDKCIFEQ